jgi:hypothetical protein
LECSHSVHTMSIEGAPALSGSVEAFAFALTLAAVSLLVRLRGARGMERQQIEWFAYATAVLAGGSTVLHVVSDALGAWWLHWEVGFVATIVGLAGLPVALGVAVLRYRLHEVDLVINRALVYPRSRRCWRGSSRSRSWRCSTCCSS